MVVPAADPAHLWIPPHGDPLFGYRCGLVLRMLVRDVLEGQRGPKLVRAANGVGKSLTVCYLVARLAVENPGTKYRITGPTRSQVRNVTGRYLWQLLQPGGHLAHGSRWAAGRGWTRNNTVILANGSEIELRSYEDREGAAAGDHQIAVNVLDEPPPESKWHENAGRGIVIVAATMVERINPVGWLRDLVEGKEGERETTPERQAGRYPMRTGWTQYVVPYTYEQVSHFLTPSEYRDSGTLVHVGSVEEPQRVWAAWEGVATDGKFGGWSPALLISRPDLLDELRDDKGRARVDHVRYGIDHGTGDGKQRQYVVLVAGGELARRRRFYVVAEHVGRRNHVPLDHVRAMARALETWLGPQWYYSDALRVFGDINSAGPLGAGASLNHMMEGALADLLGFDESPIRIESPDKTPTWKDAREIAINHAMTEGRWRVLEGAAPRAVRAFQVYRGGETDPHKDSIDALGYAVQDLMLAHDVASGLVVPR